jgi:hypothetical protein
MSSTLGGTARMDYWVVKARPDRNDFSRFPSKGRIGRWYAARLPKDWQKGDILFIWAAAPACRVIGLGELAVPDDGFDDDAHHFKVRYLSTPFEGPTIEELRSIQGD